MPNDAKLGLVVGMAVVLLIALLFSRREAAAERPVPAVAPAKADPAKATPQPVFKIGSPPERSTPKIPTPRNPAPKAEPRPKAEPLPDHLPDLPPPAFGEPLPPPAFTQLEHTYFLRQSNQHSGLS